MMATLKWFLRWYRRRDVRTKILIALLIIATFLGCFGALSPPASFQRGARPADPASTLSPAPTRSISGLTLPGPTATFPGLSILGSAALRIRG
jgi:hypothetical protein